MHLWKQASSTGVSQLKATSPGDVAVVQNLNDIWTENKDWILNNVVIVVVLPIWWSLNSHFDKVDARFGKVDEKLTSVTSRLDKVEGFLERKHGVWARFLRARVSQYHSKGLLGEPSVRAPFKVKGIDHPLGSRVVHGSRVVQVENFRTHPFFADLTCTEFEVHI